MKNMNFELLQLHRDYRNIKYADVNEPSDNFVFGHFEHLKYNSVASAEDALNLLYKRNVNTIIDSKKVSDTQPIILFTYGNHILQAKQHKCMVVSFMQIERPEECNTIKSFYDHGVKIVNLTISEAHKKKLIGDIVADVYIPLNFMDIAVAFYADSFNDVCTIVKNIMHNKLAKFQYSVLSLDNTFDFDSSASKSLNISLRFIWEKNAEATNAVKMLQDALNSLKIDDFSISHLMGNNDSLLVVPQKGYIILEQYINPKSKFSQFMKEVQNARASLSFSCDDIIMFNVEYNIKTKKTVNFDNRELITKEKQFIQCLKEIKKCLSAFEKSEIDDIIYRAIEFSKFVDVIRNHAVKGISGPLYYSIFNPYMMFLEISIQKLLEIDIDNQKDDILQIIGSYLNDTMAYYNNIFHCNLGFFEERGFYNNIIGLASDVELAYNQYTNFICNVIKCDAERNDEKLEIACAVTSGNCPTICTDDIFNSIKNHKSDKKSLLNINIPVSYVFKCKEVSNIIIHEIAHYVGYRNRKCRAEKISQTIALLICDAIYQIVSFPYGKENITDNAINVFNEFEKTSVYKMIHEQMQKDINKVVSEWFVGNVINKCNNSFYMFILIDAIVDVLNSIIDESDLLQKITDILINYQFWYYEHFEDFYLCSHSNDKTIDGILNQLSDYAIKEYNKTFVVNALNIAMNALVQPPEENKTLNLNEKSCNIYVVEMSEFIENLYYSVSEAYCDLMMITLANMSFDDYYDLMKNYDKDIDNIIKDRDYMTWLRINFVARYMNVDIFEKKDLPEIFKFYNDTNVIDNMAEYFESLRPEFLKVVERKKNNTILTNYMSKISKCNDEECFEALYSMFFDILN